MEYMEIKYIIKDYCLDFHKPQCKHCVLLVFQILMLFILIAIDWNFVNKIIALLELI